MTTVEAQQILASYREGETPDALQEKALALLDGDDELRAWYEKEKAVSNALDLAVENIAVPEHLRDSILGAVKDQPAAPAKPRRLVRKLVRIAAVFTIMAVGLFAWMDRPFHGDEISLAELPGDMGRYIERGFFFDYENTSPPALTAWFREKHGVKAFPVPEKLAQIPGLGCETIRWHDRDVYLVCFNNDDTLVHLFLLEGAASMEDFDGFDGLTTEPLERHGVDGKWATAAWKSGDDLFLMTTLGPESMLRSFL
ncbi:MAG: hypothetical protein AAGA58_02510 [Verrucomicrobiota bacterium]